MQNEWARPYKQLSSKQHTMAWQMQVDTLTESDKHVVMDSECVLSKLLSLVYLESNLT